MNTWDLILWSQAPVFFIALWIYFKDKYEKEPWTLLISCYFMGIVSACFAGITNTYFFDTFNVEFGKDYLKLFLVAIFVVGLFEEGFKFIFLKKFIYNNKNFNMIFEKNVKANYEDSELFGDKIVYLNSKRILVVSDNVKVNDTRGTMLADELLFDLDKKTLNISSYENKINANINLE